MQTNSKQYRQPRLLSYLTLLLGLVVSLGSTSCSNDDDVMEIFVGGGKTWKLTYISRDGSNQWYDFWGSNESAKKASEAAMEKEENFVLNFEGGTTGNTIGGAMNGRGTKTAFNGNWNVGADRQLTITLQNNPSETDPLAKAFVNGLKGVTRYEGDTDNLYLFSTDGQNTMRMSFHVQK